MNLSRFSTIALIAILFFSFNVNVVSANRNEGKKFSMYNASFDLFKKMKAQTKLTEKDYRGALAIYKELSDKKPENAKLAYKVGECYLLLKMKKEAITSLEKAYKLNKNVHKEIHLLLGKAYHLNNQLDKALAEYDTFKKAAGDGLQKSSGIDNLIKQCNFAKEQIKNPKNVTISNLGATVNSSYADYAPSVNADESVLIFTSRRENTTGGGKDPYDFQFNEDIYISLWDKSSNMWKNSQQISPLINTEGHDASLSISPNGQVIYIYKNDANGKNGGDIYESKLSADHSWLIPKPLPATVNSPYFESSASVTEDGSTLYFASERKGGNGNSDIYRSTKDAKGEWGPAENLGKEINTEDDEICSFISSDGKTLYFSSKGLLGMGGYDIFKSVNENGKWSPPENLGYPINSTEDDLHFVKTKNGNHGYFSSIRDNKSDRDIYLINFNEAIKTDSVVAKKEKKAPILTVKGQITDEKSKGVEAQLDFSDITTGEKLASVSTNNLGEYTTPLESGKTYTILIKSKGYEEIKETLEVPRDSTAALNKAFKLKKSAEEPLAKVLVSSPSIYFAFGSSKLKLNKQTKETLNNTITQLKQDKNLTIEVVGFSDNKGKEKINKIISQRRANTVAAYINKRGVQKKRIQVAFNGSSQPVSSNDTKEGRSLNRRVELKLK